MRTILNLNQGWTFFRGEEPSMEVNLPHTWNNLDGQDGGNDYFRGVCRYEKHLPKVDLQPGQRAYVEFQGVGSIADVSADGQALAHHEGAFSTFRADVTSYLGGQSVLRVSADNGANDRVYPQFADFTFCGGIYRDVLLIVVPQSHFSLEDAGGPGARLWATLAEGQAQVQLSPMLNCACEDLRVRAELLDAAGAAVSSMEAPSQSPSMTLTFSNPHLWNGVEDPYLYTAKLSLMKGETELDQISLSFGVRSLTCDPDKGFFLNGKAYPLRGVSRHQDRLDKGWAISKADHEEDIRIIREVGANTIRLAHYQHDPYFYDLCDRYGMVVWAEIPYISKHLPTARENTVSQMTELVIQNLHHASIFCWGLSNEITMNGVTEDLMENHRILNDLCHSLDPSRLTTMACVSMLDTDSPLLNIPDILSYNHYFGWYGGNVGDNGPWLDAFHASHPQTCLGLSEYGCEGILSWHSDTPKMGDYSEEYQAYYHQKMLETFDQRPYLWSTHVWNMFDFGSDMRDEGGVKGRNNKGLVTYDRKTRKDSFYVYMAWWSKTPFVHIAGKRFRDRPGKTANITVYSNQSQVELYVGERLLEKQTGSKVFHFTVPIRLLGDTRVTAKAGECADTAAFHRVKRPNPKYSMDSAPGAVINWFDKDGKPAEMLYPKDHFSIRDTIEDIMKTQAGKKLMEAVLSNAMSQMAGSGLQFDDKMMKMVGGFTIERVTKMAGKRIDPAMIVELNRALNKIPKP